MNKKIKNIKPIKGGGLFLSFDFSSLEVNVFTGMADEKDLKEILNTGADLHSSMAKKVFADELKDVPVEKVKELYPHLRSFSKGATFGTLYGSSEFNLADQLNIPVDRAKNIIDSLMKAFPGIERYVNNCHDFARANGYIDTFFGIRRYLDSSITMYNNETEERAKELIKKSGLGGRFKHALNASQNHCFPAGTLILCDGNECDHYKPIEQITENDLIYCYDEDKKEYILRHAKLLHQGKKNLIKVTLSSGESFKCTSDHEIYSNGRWIQAQYMVGKPIFNNKDNNIIVESIRSSNIEETYDLSIIDNDIHNFFIQLDNNAILVHNCVQSNASIVGWICATHIQDEFILQGMKSRVIGNVHDSVEMDIYPGEFQDALRIVKYHADTLPNTMYPKLLNGVKLRFDFEGGKSWGRAGEYKKVEFLEDGTTYLKFKGGNLYWDEIETELKKAYHYEIISYEEGRDLEVSDKNPLPQPTKEVVVEFKILDKANITEFKSKYYVGDGALDSKDLTFHSIMENEI